MKIPNNYTESKPKYCCWVLNYRCPLKCKVCYIWQTEEHTEETTLDKKKRFVSSLKGFVDQDFEFHLSGGEPLMNNDIDDIIQHIHSCNFRTNLVTNGWLADREMIQKLSHAGLPSLTFSLDGMNAETHDFLRGTSGSYQRIMDAIDIIRTMDTGMKVSILSLITEYNLDEILPLADWVQKHPALAMISFQAITQPFSQKRDDRWYEKEENAFLWPQNKKKAGRIMDELHDRRLQGQKIGNHHNHFMAFKRYFENPNRFLKAQKCNLGDYEFHVDPFGKVFFCCFTEPVGNIKTDSIPDVWFTEQTRVIRESVYACKQNCHIMINCFFEEERNDTFIKNVNT